MLRHISEIFQICVYYLRPSPMIVHESITSHTLLKDLLLLLNMKFLILKFRLRSFVIKKLKMIRYALKHIYLFIYFFYIFWQFIPSKMLLRSLLYYGTTHLGIAGHLQHKDKMQTFSYSFLFHFGCLPVCLSVCLFVFLVYPSVHWSVCVLACMSVRLSLSVFLSTSAVSCFGKSNSRKASKAYVVVSFHQKL